MNQLWVFYKDTYQQLHIHDKQMITIGNELQHTLTIQAFTIDKPLSIEKNKQTGIFEVFHGTDFLGELPDQEERTFQLHDQAIHMRVEHGSAKETTYYTGMETEITIPTEYADSSSTLYQDHGDWFIQIRGENVYINGESQQGVIPLYYGDIIFQPYTSIRLAAEDLLVVTAADEFKLDLPQMKKPTTVMKERYPNYRRTPRMIYDLPEDNVSFSFPSEEREDHGRGLLMIIMPPLMMLLVMGLVAIIRPRGIFILISLAMFGTTLVTSTVQFFKEKKKQKERKEKRYRLYTRYLEDKRQELQTLSKKQRDVLYFHFPAFEKMKYYTAEISDRIWERNMMSHDFLEFRVGRATIPSSYTVSDQNKDMSNQEIDDLLLKSQELVGHYKEVQDVPLVIDLADGAMGMIGKDDVVKREIQQIVGQLSFSQSYHDIRFIAVFSEEEYEAWEWMKWLPHFQLPHAYAKGLIYNDQTRDQLLTSVYEILKERDLEEEKEKKVFAPHFIFIITNRQLISEHAILEYLEGEHEDIGFSTIFAADTKESLSENIHTLVRYINDGQGDILIQEQKAAHIPFELDEHHQQGNENFSRTLRSLNHQLGMSHSLPDKVTFLELFDTEDVTELAIQKRWIENQSSKSLAVPVGLKGKDDPVYLNLHEKAHGPHGLLAGTTGSGKSEFLQTYILSLAMHYHPHEVAFLLIDYKGGGMALLFKEIPHLLGTITNIEGSKNFSKRALASIKSEMKQRQRLFDEYEVNHINDYTDLYKEGNAKQPLPHLFLISDEFAELKSEEPEFINELVSAARIGRSLGVHLILATQKPGGIIDDQIWSNSRFKVALKVQDESDSKEILKNGDAAKITVTGRGYLQVGNNEVYELFQSAWSGASYSKEVIGTEDEVALVTDLGLIPLSDVTAEDHQAKKKKTEIEAVVEEILRIQAAMNIEQLDSPWLPPLSHRLVADAGIDRAPHHYPLGVIDEPERQSQAMYMYEAMEDGNIGIFGSSGYGKSTTILTLLLGMASENSPEDFQCYLFDFGNGALLPLQQLPQTGDYFRSDDERKIEKFMVFISEEMEERKQLFNDHEVSSINMYNLTVPEKLPLIYITIDNFDLVKDEMFERENRFTQIARDGQSLGIYTILTATRSNAVKHALMSNLKTRIVHYLLDDGDKSSIVGRTQYETEAIPGRVYIKQEDAHLAQIYLPVEGETDVELLTHLKEKVQHIKDKYTDAKKPISIPMLPRQLEFIAFHENYHVVDKSHQLAIGLDEDSVQPVYLDWQANRHCLVLGDPQRGKTNVIKLMIDQFESIEGTQIGLFDSVNRTLADYADDDQITYLEVKEQINEWVEMVEQEFMQREEAYRAALRDRSLSKKDDPPYVLIIDGMSQFLQEADPSLQTKLVNLMKNYSHLGFTVVASGNATELSKGFDAFISEVKQIKQAVMLMKKSSQTMMNLPYTRNEPEVRVGYGYYVLNGQAQKIQIPHYNVERALQT